MPATHVAKSVPWSRLKPRRKYWLAFARAAVLRHYHARDVFEEVTGTKQRPVVDQLRRDDAFAGRVAAADTVVVVAGDVDLA
jgi:hypothetical protein